jgi:transcriptional regulator with XRE-family HTH domain
MFGKRLKALRLEKGLSQSELGRLVSLKSQTISHYETGYRSPSVVTINHLCEIFNVTSDYLLGRSQYRQYPATDTHAIVRRLIDDIHDATSRASENLKDG